MKPSHSTKPSIIAPPGYFLYFFTDTGTRESEMEGK